MWGCILLIPEKEGTICQVSVSTCVKLFLVNYQVQLYSRLNPSLVFTIILVNAVIPSAFKTREKCCTGDRASILPIKQVEQIFFCLMTQANLGKITVRRLSTLKCGLLSLLSNFSPII